MVYPDANRHSGSHPPLTEASIDNLTGWDSHVCIHSNRVLAKDLKAAHAVGADVCLPKPMSRTHLLRQLDDPS
jgi:hypothetical protein